MATSFDYQKDARGVGRIIFNRPQRHNAFDDAMIAELAEFFSTPQEDLVLVVLSGNGPSFCAGADVNWMKRMKDYGEEENVADARKMAQMFSAINGFPRPVVAQVHGAALGGGGGLLAVCDFVLASEDCKLGFTETRLGLVPAVISPFVVSKIGESMARAYMLSGERFSPQRGVEMNLIHKVVPREKLEEEGKRVIASFLKAGPVALGEAKVLLGEVVKIGFKGEAVTDYTCKTIARIRASEEAQQGMEALLAKKKPPWITS